MRLHPVAAALLVAVLLPACQLVDDTADLDASAAASEASEAALLGSPAEDWPRTLAGLRALIRPEALRWQDGSVLADLTVWLDPGGAWERARLTYVAADADRMLTVRSAPDLLRLERPRLEGLTLLELPPAAVQAIAPLPPAVLEPAALGEASRAALLACDADGAVRAVLYATGAPAAWDGERWTTPPTWRATVLTDEAGVVVDPTTGSILAPLTCVDPLHDQAD